MKKKKEYLDVLDENENMTGEQKEKDKILRDKNYRRAVHLWIMNPENEKILLQKRSRKKASHAMEWDITAGGHIKTGESSFHALIRETYEELSLDIQKDCPKKLLEVKDKYYFYDVYVLFKKVSLKDLKLQKEEVSDISYFSIPEIKAMYLDPNAKIVRQKYVSEVFHYFNTKKSSRIIY